MSARVAGARVCERETESGSSLSPDLEQRRSAPPAAAAAPGARLSLLSSRLVSRRLSSCDQVARRSLSFCFSALLACLSATRVCATVSRAALGACASDLAGDSRGSLSEDTSTGREGAGESCFTSSFTHGDRATLDSHHRVSCDQEAPAPYRLPVLHQDPLAGL